LVVAGISITNFLHLSEVVFMPFDRKLIIAHNNNMLIFYGLGNNEAKYLNTKHNIGRIVVEQLAAKLEINFVDSGQGCMVAKAKVDQTEIWLVYSKGYMNLSGEPISKLIKYYKLQSQDYQLAIIQDDSDQVIGSTKIMPGGGTAGHNGIISSYNYLASLVEQKEIWRLKIGIRPQGNKLKSETFVLSPINFAESENAILLSQTILNNLSHFQIKNIGKLQNIVHTKTIINQI
jgi:peptidyl-tRNA hydrolase, PTH1 family